jgi:hypothetical protein
VNATLLSSDKDKIKMYVSYYSRELVTSIKIGVKEKHEEKYWRVGGGGDGGRNGSNNVCTCE